MRKEANEFDVMGISPSAPVDMFPAITNLLGNRSGSSSHVQKYRKTTESFGRLRERKWRTLEHNGVMFPPEYEPHRVKILYKRRPVHLNPDQEEVMSSSLGSDYGFARENITHGTEIESTLLEASQNKGSAGVDTHKLVFSSNCYSVSYFILHLNENVLAAIMI